MSPPFLGIVAPKLYLRRMSETSPGHTPKKLFIKTYGCQMNVYDPRPHGRCPGAARLRAGARSMEDADLVVLNTCHIREKASEKVLLRTRPPARAARRAPAHRRRPDDRRRRLRRAGRGRRDRRAAPRPWTSSSARRAYHRLPELMARVRPWRARSSTPTSPRKTSSSTCRPPRRKSSVSRGLTAFLTVQEGCDKFCSFCVVPYTRGAETSRPLEQVLREAEQPRRSRCARAHAARPERQRLSRARRARPHRWPRRALLPPVADPRHCPHPLHHQPPARHERRADRDAPRPRCADALPASAGPVGLGPHPQGDEPPPHRGRVHGRARAHQGRPAGYGACRAISSSASPAKPMPISRTTLNDRARGRLRLGLHLQILDPPRHARRHHGRTRSSEAVKTERLARLNELITDQMRAFLRSVVGRTLPVLIEKPGRHAGPGRWPLAVPAGRAHGWARPGSSARSCRSEIIAAGNNSLTGKIVTVAEPNPASVLESQATAAHI